MIVNLNIVDILYIYSIYSIIHDPKYRISIWWRSWRVEKISLFAYFFLKHPCIGVVSKHFWLMAPLTSSWVNGCGFPLGLSFNKPYRAPGFFFGEDYSLPLSDFCGFLGSHLFQVWEPLHSAGKIWVPFFNYTLNYTHINFNPPTNPSKKLSYQGFVQTFSSSYSFPFSFLVPLFLIQ